MRTLDFELVVLVFRVVLPRLRFEPLGPVEDGDQRRPVLPGGLLVVGLVFLGQGWLTFWVGDALAPVPFVGDDQEGLQVGLDVVLGLGLLGVFGDGGLLLRVGVLAFLLSSGDRFVWGKNKE